MDPMTPEQAADYARVDRSLTNHTPGPVSIEKIEAIRSQAKNLAAEIILASDPSRERSLALTHLEDSVMWAVKSVILANVEVSV